MIRITLALILFASAAPAQDIIDETSPAIQAILNNATAECEAVTEGDANAPKAELVLEPGAITWLDLDGGFERNDTVIDFNFVYCTAMISLWGGSGGSLLYFVLNGETSRSWTGGDWRVTEFGLHPLILIGRHGTWCDSSGARPCVQAITADEEGFWTALDGRALEDAGKSDN